MTRETLKPFLDYEKDWAEKALKDFNLFVSYYGDERGRIGQVYSFQLERWFNRWIVLNGCLAIGTLMVMEEKGEGESETYNLTDEDTLEESSSAEVTLGVLAFALTGETKSTRLIWILTSLTRIGYLPKVELEVLFERPMPNDLNSID